MLKLAWRRTASIQPFDPRTDNKKVGNLHSGGKTEQAEEKTTKLQAQTVYQQSCTYYKC